MNAPTRLAAYGAGLAVLLTGGFVLGDRTDLGAVDNASASHSSQTGESSGGSHTSDDMNGMEEMEGMDMGSDTGSDTGSESAQQEVPGGLQVSEAGHTLEVPSTGYKPGAQTVSFQVIGPDGQAVTDYDEAHEKELHLIAVRRDFSGFQHVHPTLDQATGTWSIDVSLTSGTWRIFADFVPAGGEALTLGADVFVSGDPGRQRLPQPVKTATVGDYTVTVTGDLTAGEHSMLDFEVTRNGQPVTNLEPYLGAYGHLVALREGDLAYLHVHPGGEPGDGETEPGPIVEFGAEVPSPGRYQMFLDFKVDGVVRTAPFTIDAGAAATPEDDTSEAEPSEGSGEDSGSHGH